MTPDTCYGTGDPLLAAFHRVLSNLVLVLVSAHVERFSVCRVRDFFYSSNEASLCIGYYSAVYWIQCTVDWVPNKYNIKIQNEEDDIRFHGKNA